MVALPFIARSLLRSASSSLALRREAGSSRRRMLGEAMKARASMTFCRKASLPMIG
jgi:hypothetical protein